MLLLDFGTGTRLWVFGSKKAVPTPAGCPQNPQLQDALEALPSVIATR
jgi:hypothetical protein